MKDQHAIILNTLQLLCEPGALHELRALNVPGHGGRLENRLGFFDDFHAMAKAAELLDAAGTSGVYLTPNPVNVDQHSRTLNRVQHARKGAGTKNTDVARRRWFLLDFDPKKPKNASASDSEKAEARSRAETVRSYLAGLGFPNPVFADSGNGYHLMYRVDLPADDAGLLARCTNVLSSLFSDDLVIVDSGVHNAARIWKLYGTEARKGPSTPERPHRVAHIIDPPFGTRATLAPVPITLLEALAASGERPRPAVPRFKQPRRDVDHRTTAPSEIKRTAAAPIDVERVKSALFALPPRPAYDDWIRIIAAVLDGLGGDEDTAEALLSEWSPEEEAGEYARKLQSPLESITVGTLYYYANRHGWVAPPQAGAQSSAPVGHVLPQGSASDTGSSLSRSCVSPRQLDGVTTSDKSAAEPWPDPLPIQHASGRHPVQSIEADWIPGGVRRWVADIAHRMQITLDFPAVAALVMLSACIGRRLGIRPMKRDSWTVIPNLWGAIIGRPGLMKSPVLKQITAPLVRLHMEAQRAHDEAMKLHEGEELAFEATKTAVREQVKKARKSNPTADVSHLTADLTAPEKPPRTEYVVYDSTPEALIETAQSNPLGFLQLRDELSGLLARLSASTAGEERAIYLGSWNGDDSIAQTRIGRGHVFAEALCQALLGGIQPGKLTEILTSALRGGMGDDGLIQRFQLLVQPDLPPDFELVDEWPDNDAKQEAYLLVERLVHLDAKALGAQQDTRLDGEPEGVPFLRFDAEAQELFYTWRINLERSLRTDALHPALESHFAKYRSLIPALALILHLADGGTGPVSRPALERALAWDGYLRSHALRVYGTASTGGEAAARQLGRKLLDGKLEDGFTVRTIYRKGWSGLGTQEEAQAAVDALVDHGWLREESGTAGQRTFTAHRLNPGLRGLPRQYLLPPRGTPPTH